MQEWSATLERQLPWGLKATLGYIGSNGIHLYNDQNYNTNIPTAGTQFRPISPTVAAGLPICTAGNAVFSASGCAASSAGYGVNGAGFTPNTAFSVLQWFTPTTTSNYHAGILTVSRNVGKGIQFNSVFTYSRCLDYGSSSTPGIDQPGDSEQFVFPSIAKKYNYGPCAFNITKNWTSSALIPIPLHGNRLKEGWQFAVIQSARTGTPETANLSGTFDEENMGQYFGLTQRADVNPNFTGPFNVLKHVLNSSNTVTYFSTAGCGAIAANTCPFSVPAIGHLGSASKATIIAPNVVNIDLSIVKRTKLPKFGEAAALEIRGDFFNSMNHTNFSLPNTTIYNGSVGKPTVNSAAGTISATATPARQLQFSARFVF